MDQKLIRDIRMRMASMSTKELSSIYEAHDRTIYTEDAFEAIRQILAERGENYAPIAPIENEQNQSESKNSGEKHTKTNIGCLSIVGFIAIIIFGIILSAICSTPKEKNTATTSSNIAITAHVSKSLTSITVENGDNFDWPSVELYINGDATTGIIGSYEYKYGTVKSGDKITIPLILFTKDDVRFQPLERSIQRFVVYVPGYSARLFEY
jgi:hypothetical protein